MRVKIGRVISHQQDILRLNATTCLVEEVEGTVRTDIHTHLHTQTNNTHRHTKTHVHHNTGSRTNKHAKRQELLVEDADDTVRSTRLILFCWAVRQRDGE